MYRLTVVAGPTRGNSYPLHEGETTIGRHSTNGLVLNSGKVSKRHCTLVVSNGEVVVKDQGSANGTFVNGVLARTPRQIIAGDRVSVGEFVLELSVISKDSNKRAVALPVGVGAYDFQSPARLPAARQKVQSPVQAYSPGLHGGMPRDPKGRLVWIFEYRVMPFFYALLLKHEWRTLVFGAFGAFGLLTLLFVIAPQVGHEEALVLRELERRATVMAKVVVEHNAGAIQQQLEGKTGVPAAISRAKGVRQALLVDLDSRILAPAERYNQYLSEGSASVLARKAKRLFLDEGRTTPFVSSLDSGSVVAIEPMLLYSPREGKNIPVAMGVVSIDAGSALLGAGEVAVIFFEALIILGLIGAVLGVVLYRVTLKPLQILHEEVDRSLKGERLSLTREVKFTELGQLLDMVEIALQRATVASSGSGEAGADHAAPTSGLSEDVLAGLRLAGERLGSPMAVCDADQRPVYMNPVFEEVTGIRLEIGETRPLHELAREQALGVLLVDLFERSPGSLDGINESFEFSGVPFQVRMVALASASGAPRGFVLVAHRMEAG